MVQFKKEIMILITASLMVMSFPLWVCLFNIHFKSSALFAGGLKYPRPKESSLIITFFLLVSKVHTRYNLDPIN